ncbi:MULTISPECIES: response regulator [unclassified Methylobacterium]|uniref:response regulator n=1 Tax=unclassified Methylobacterium TaxID=2615210 RepID=UPI0006FD1A97|nr:MULTISPECIES: response regulator [unclassified Methylobacterium]KQP92395.1 two-component system response regulator [Methylobacterium sp. Leaf113]KQP96050.1 two-component system response regulator [Methylobacterium sp. Leaf117]MCK2055143.1 response regulator [Methylobacterium sp. 37f]
MAAPSPRLGSELPDHAPHILVVDDDRRVRELLSRFLYEQGFRVTSAGNVPEARIKAQCFVFDALVLDVMMPGESGFDYAREVRQTSRVPILMLTARSNPNDRVMGLEIGADDYLPKPFEPRELILRLSNIIKRRSDDGGRARGHDTVTFGPFSYRIDRGELRREDETIRITEREREILTILAQAGGANVEREALAGSGGLAAERSIDVQINRLRRKTEVDPTNPLFLQTVRGVGYRLAID